MSAAASRQLISIGPFEFDAASGLLYRGQHEILLPLRAGKVLEVFLFRPGEVLSKEELLGEVWKDAYVGEDSLTQAISMIRSALGDDPRDPTYIQTIPKRGYRFIAEVRAEPGVGEEVPTEPVARIPEAAAEAQGGSFGHFEILGELGSGAMGVVYRAKDTVLEREVAIKMLPEDFVSDPGRVARFEKEAKLLAAVSHPNIAAIHSLEEADGTKFPVMELVEGETLEQRLRAGPSKVEEALEIARQIASALEAAHERGIVHRDLKPANIKLTPSGQVKVLDFGLAKVLNVQVFGEGVSESPTESITIMGSRRGSIVGTAAYMSPEQARGQEVNKQADIWSFGCVLYEMLTGRRPFIGDTVSDTIAGVLERQPDWGELPTETPRAAHRLLRRCLTKDPRDRLRDIGDARFEIEEAQAGPSRVQSPTSVVPHSGPSWRLAISFLAVAVLIGTTAGVLGTRLATTPTTQPVRAHLTLELEEGLRLWGGQIQENQYWAFQRPSRTAIALSPAGDVLVYAATDGQSAQLYARDLEQPHAIPIPGTEGGFSPFFAPDGERVGFFVPLEQRSVYALKVASLAGGGPRTIVDRIEVLEGTDGTPFGASWGDDEIIIYSPGESAPLLQVSANGGEPKAATDLAGDYSHRLPTILPGGRATVFTVLRSSLARIVARRHREDDGPQKVLVEHGSDARFSPTAHLLYMLDGSLMAVPFDPEGLEVVGDPVRVVEDVVWASGAGSSSLNTGAGQFTFSKTGTLVYATGGATPEVPSLLAWVDRQGRHETLPLAPREYLYPRISPDGRHLAYARGRPGEKQISIYDIASGIETQLTFEGGSSPVWSPDGSEIVFWGGGTLQRMPVNGSRPPEAVLEPGPPRAPSSWSHQGFIAYVENDDIWILDLDQGTTRPFVVTPYADRYPVFSPDGGWLAYASNRSDRSEIYVAPFPDGVPERKVSIERGISPVWSADGRELFYYRWGPEWQVWVADVGTSDTFEFDPPRQLMEFAFDRTHPVRNFDVQPDGRFVVIPSDYEVEPQPVTKLHVVLNWFEKLKRLVPTGR